jgi:hypothetical protein
MKFFINKKCTKKGRIREKTNIMSCREHTVFHLSEASARLSEL